MSENQPEGYMDEGLEAPEVTDEQIQDFIDRGGEAPSYHPILRIWREVLSNAENEIGARVTPQWANRITSSYRELNFADMPRFRDNLFGKLMEYASILETEIETDEDCLKPKSPEEDVEHNSGHYKAMLAHWQILLLQWELDWDCTAPDAGLEIAAISEVHKMVFGPTGLTAFLDNIKFEYTEADQAELAEVLDAMKEGR